MADDQYLSPCPFCQGPPKAWVCESPFSGPIPRKDDYGDEGAMAYGFVSCHECGSQGPAYGEWIHDSQDWDAVRKEGMRLWQERNSRHISLFVANIELNKEECADAT
ncbi:hypothetical protein [Allopusillimonas ginsengisoli]|uniref:hypothetical protein n=1 Tax=Allopusillimonas ginsengisoli TaxID=453575 RepID=UPI0010212F35|nr:hypothetical protein [Allopusillimonas ginsengisoli]TEA78654.1 hypothetical protein ERE07_09670 [Allopusillimonas ginsengisoli]